MRLPANILLSLVTSAVAACNPLTWIEDKVKGPTDTVRLGKVARKDLIQRVTIAGHVVPNRRTIITPPYNGYVRKIFVRIGDQVKAGDPVVSIAQSLHASDPIFPMRAPFSGTVVHVEKSEGEYVKEANQDEYLMRIDDLSQLFVVAQAPEIDRTKLRIGQETVIKASAVIDRNYAGIIRDISLAAKESSRGWRSQVEFPVRMEVTNKDEKLRPGMSVVIDIVIGKKTDTLTLGHEFIQRDGDQTYVILKNNERRQITVGLQNEEDFEIREGLSEGEEIKQVDFVGMMKKG